MNANNLLTTVIALLLGASLLSLSSCKEECEIPPVSSFFEGQYATYPNIVDTTGGILQVEIPSEGTASILGKSIWYSDSEVKANTVPPWEQTGTMYFEDSKGRPIDRIL